MNLKITHLWEKLNAHYPTYLVGGAVRDMLIGNSPSDFDFATKARPGEIIEVFQGHKVDFVGAHFGVVLVDGVEFATFRRDIGDTVEYSDTIEEDLARRDFTMNAMAQDITGRLIDPFAGENDISVRRMIQFVGVAVDRIKEDPVRMLRALRFASSLDFRLHPDVEYALCSYHHLLLGIPKERIQLELMKVLETRGGSKFFHWAQHLGVLPFALPTIGSTYGHVGGNHHPETVWEHLMMTGDAVHPKFPMVKLAGYLHDVGKPQTYNPEDGSFLQHHNEGEHIVRATLTRLKFSTAQIEAVAGLTRCHMHTVLKGSSPKSIRKLIKKLSEYGLTWRDFLRLRIADHKANLSKKPYTISEIKEYVKAFQVEEKVTLRTHNLALTGGEIIQLLGIQPGPYVGQLQKLLLEFVLEHGEEHNDKERLAHWVKDLHNR